MAEGGCARSVIGVLWFNEVEGSMQEGVGVGWVDRVCPSNVFGGVRCCGWVEFDAVEVFDDAVVGGAAAVPNGPPAVMLCRESAVGRRVGEEVAIVFGCWHVGGGFCLWEVYLDDGAFGS